MAANTLDITNGTLVANTASSVTRTKDVSRFAVTHTGNVTGVLWVRYDGSAATVAGNANKPVLPGQTVEFARTTTLSPVDTTSVSLISSGAVLYSVEF